MNPGDDRNTALTGGALEPTSQGSIPTNVAYVGQQPLSSTTTYTGGGQGLGTVPGEAAYSTTTVSTAVDPSTGAPVTTYATATYGAVPTVTDDGRTAGYAAYSTYTATTVGKAGM